MGKVIRYLHQLQFYFSGKNIDQELTKDWRNGAMVEKETGR
jgi:hypothetical protein